MGHALVGEPVVDAQTRHRMSDEAIDVPLPITTFRYRTLVDVIAPTGRTA
jgi:hypothetical protein